MSGGYKVPPGDDDRLAKALAEIRRRLDELERPTGTQLAQSLEQLADQLANQVSPAVGSNTTGSFTFGTSFANVVSFNFTVPPGYTRAVIMSGGVVSAGSPAGNDTLTARTVVGGVANAASLSFCAAAVGETTTPCFGANSLSGLSGGATIAVVLQAHWATGASATGLLTAQVAATCIFLK